MFQKVDVKYLLLRHKASGAAGAPAWNWGGSRGSLDSLGQAKAPTDLTGLANENGTSHQSVKAVVAEQTKVCEARGPGGPCVVQRPALRTMVC